MTFELDKEEQTKFKEWNDKHKCDLKNYSGAIGGRLTWKITDTGLGRILVCECGCGEKLDFTDYEDW